ncbi:MAG: panthothenate synthetase, partial [Acidobacteria bacterium]|nr:panthothenate synthetase [Acidobacteriota bacterium]
MRMLVHAKIPHEPFNTAVRNGTADETLRRILADTKPEAVYFTEYNGRRGAIMIVDIADPSKVPALAEPWFLSFNADVEFHIVMSP